MADHPIIKTYFGIASSVAGIFCVLSLLANYGAVYLNISYEIFGQINNLTALSYCFLTPGSFVLGVIGCTRKNDSIFFSIMGISLVVIPFLFIFAQFIYSFIK